MKYKIGQIVKVVRKQTLNGFINIGDKGKIVSIAGNEVTPCSIGVEFFHYVYGHTCNGKGRSGYCWCIDPDDLEIVNESNEIVTVSSSKGEVLNNLLMKYPNLSKYFNV